MVIEGKRGEVTLTMFLIALIVVGLFTVTIFTLVSELGNEYEDYVYESDAMNLSALDRVDEVYDDVTAAQDQFNDIDTNNPLDVIGKTFSGGIIMTKATVESSSIAVDISQESIRNVKKSQTDENANGNTIWSAISTSAVTIVVILFAITILLAIVTGRRT